MDLNSFITALITSLGGTGLFVVLMTFFVKKWVSSRIEESVRHEYAIKLEEHKVQLQEQVSRSVKKIEAEYQEIIDQKKVDKALFAKFMSVLPSSGSIEFINRFNMAGWSFNRDEFKQLDNFHHDWSSPEYQFLDKQIDDKRKRLHELVAQYLAYLAINTFPVRGAVGISSVPEEWEEEQPERFHETVTKLHEFARLVVEAHSDLVKTARNHLKC